MDMQRFKSILISTNLPLDLLLTDYTSLPIQMLSQTQFSIKSFYIILYNRKMLFVELNLV